MNKADIVRKVAEGTGIRQADAAAIVEGILETMSEELIRGGHVELRGFGTFHVVTRAQRSGINPATGQRKLFPARKTPVFRPAKRLKEKVNH